MNFELSEEQRLIKDMVRDFAENEVAPSAAELDEEERFDRALMFDRLAELGLTGIIFPEEYGGGGADYLSYAIAVEELSRVCASTGVTLSAHISLGANPIYLFGSEEQKQTFLKPLARGEKMGAFGLTEPAAGSDAGGTKATAVKDGADWVLNGTKIFITNGGDAETYVVLARTDKDAKKHHGISAFIVEKGTPGFTFGKKEKKMGIRSSPTMELVFENCRIPGGNLLGEEGSGFKVAMKTLDGGRIGIAAQAVGIAQGAFEEALAYAQEREAFGQKIGEFQMIQKKIADMVARTEQARAVVYRLGRMLDADAGRASLESSLAKLSASEAATQNALDAIQVYGGYGYTREYPIEQLARDCKIASIYEGTDGIQAMDLLGRKLGMIDDTSYQFPWVTRFPLMEYDEIEKRYQALHHPFTAPLEEDYERLESAPDTARSRAYDLVLNGHEVGGGSIRIHNTQLQARVFKALGMAPEEYQNKFGFLLDALGEAQRLAATEEGFGGEAIAVAPQWSIAALRRRAESDKPWFQFLNGAFDSASASAVCARHAPATRNSASAVAPAKRPMSS